MKFRKGDRVRQLRDLMENENPMATIVGYDSGGDVQHIHDNNEKVFTIDEEAFELIEAVNPADVDMQEALSEAIKLLKGEVI